MSENAENERIFNPPENIKQRAYINDFSKYKDMYDRSIENPEEFWAEIANEFYWKKKWDKVRSYNFSRKNGKVNIKWFDGAMTNITYNALDRHLADKGDQTAIIWEGNEPGEDAKFTYKDLHALVCKFANVLKEKGIKKGDVVAIYMPMVPELAIAMMACARIGAIHSIVFGGFSPEALADRIMDSSCRTLITTDGTFRGKKPVPLKVNADKSIDICKSRGHAVTTCIVTERVGAGKGIDTHMEAGRDYWWHDLMANASDTCEPEWMNAEDPLFILYTSGSTGKPKGVMHTVGGYMIYTTTTFKYIFDYHPGDIYWCTADIGWVTGHSYIVYGPLCAGAISIMFEGIPTYPDAGRFWDVVDKYKVNQFYTAPTAIRALASKGEKFVQNKDLSSLRILGSVGEPINPEAWMWYHNNVGRGKCPIVDTWWQTETGGILITPLPGATPLKPGSATFPFFGVNPGLMDEQGNELTGENSGMLVIKEPWPGMMRTVFGDHQRFEETYFSMFDGFYFTGDGCRRDKDGYYWITGRVDDVLNVSGHRMGTAEVESALVSHDAVAEAAVVGFPHEIKGQGIYAYVTLNAGVDGTDDLKKTLLGHVTKEIGPIAKPDRIHFTDALPKTRSGKIMRRILRKIAANELDNFGDTSTLADPGVVQILIDGKQ